MLFIVEESVDHHAGAVVSASRSTERTFPHDDTGVDQRRCVQLCKIEPHPCQIKLGLEVFITVCCFRLHLSDSVFTAGEIWHFFNIFVSSSLPG